MHSGAAYCELCSSHKVLDQQYMAALAECCKAVPPPQVKQKEAQRYRLAAAAAADGGGASDGDRLYQQMVSDPSCESLLPLF